MMTRLFAAAVACLSLALALCPPAHAAVFHMRLGAGSGFGGACALDGHTGAPTGTPVFAARKAVWAFPPPCQTPDVDYNVGPDPAVTLLSPSAAVAALGNANVTYDSTNNLITCVGGTSGLVLQNIDFTIGGTRSGGGFLIGGGSSVPGDGCNNLTIRNFKIALGCLDPSPQFPLKQQTNSSGLTVTKGDISNPNGLEANACTAGGETIFFTGPGLQSVTYTRISGAPQHNISFTCQIGNTCTSVAKYNSVSATGWGEGNHVNGIQWLGTFAASDVSNNYWYNPQPSVADSTRQACFGPNTCTNNPGGSAGTVSIASGQMILQVTGTNQGAYIPGMQVTGSGFSGTAYICAVTDYIGPVNGPDYVLFTLKGDVGCTAPVTTTAGVGTATVQNAAPFGIANPIRYANQGAVSGQMTNGIITGNVFDGDGPVKGGTNAITCGGDSTGNEVNGLSITKNYFRPAGYQGFIYTQAAFCLNVTGSGNKSLDDGTTITVP